MIKFVNELSDLRVQISGWKRNGYIVGLVPTMGSLHDGHLSLLSIAREHCDKVVTSIYVNPKQFSENEDFCRYPRDVNADLEKLSSSNACDLVYQPNNMYHKKHKTEIVPNGVALNLETETRPHFFDGVSTIVLKLFNQIQPDIAIFGEKDYQQLLVVKQLMLDLDLPIQIVAGKIFREKDGLAMSSRNAYLSENERRLASNIYRILKLTRKKIQLGFDVSKVIKNGISELESIGINKIDYFSLRDPDNLESLNQFNKDSRLLIALYVGTTRLIDNISVPFINNRETDIENQQA